MRCPSCGSTRTERFRSPVEKGEVTLRRHQCRECGTIFLSAQLVITEELVEVLEATLT